MWEAREVYTGIWWGALRGRYHLEDLGIGGRILLNVSSRSGMGGGMDWIYLAQDRDRRRALVNAAMNIQVP